MSGYLDRVWYTITASAEKAEAAAARFRTNGMIAGAIDIETTTPGYHVFVAAGIWISDDDYDGDQLADHEFMNINTNPSDDNFFDLNVQQQQFICQWVRRKYAPFMGHRWNGPRVIPHGDIWKKIGEYVDNPPQYTWTFMSIDAFFIFPS